MDSIIKSIQQEDKSQSQRSNLQSLLERLSNCLSLLTATNELNNSRKEILKSEVSGAYKTLCTSSSEVTEFLFGGDDLPQAINDLSKIEKTMNKIRNRPSANRNRPSAKSSQSHRQIFKTYAHSSRSFGGTNMFKSNRNQGRSFLVSGKSWNANPPEHFYKKSNKTYNNGSTNRYYQKQRSSVQNKPGQNQTQSNNSRNR